MGVFGAVCQDLGISCKPEALRVYLRRPTGPDAPPPAMPAWDPIKGQLVQVGATLMADDSPTRQLGVPRAPLARSNAYQLRVQEKMNVALASLAAMHLEWPGGQGFTRRHGQLLPARLRTTFALAPFT